MHDILQKNLTATFGLEGLSDEEQVAFLDELGTVVLETALVRLMASLDDDKVASLNYYLDTEPTPDALMEHLLTQYARFEELLTEAIVEVKEDAMVVLGDEEVTENDQVLVDQ
jgi:hypothetical protein